MATIAPLNITLAGNEVVELLLWYGFLGVINSQNRPVFIYDRAYDFSLLRSGAWAGHGRMCFTPLIVHSAWTSTSVTCLVSEVRVGVLSLSKRQVPGTNHVDSCTPQRPKGNRQEFGCNDTRPASACVKVFFFRAWGV